MPSISWDISVLPIQMSYFEKNRKYSFIKSNERIRHSLNNWSVGSSGDHFPGTQAREKKSDTAANSCSLTGFNPVQSGLINFSVISYKKKEIKDFRHYGKRDDLE